MGLPRLAMGRETTGHWDAAVRREWLVTDGTGSYAMGTVAGARTRRHHGHLVVALQPPVARTLVVGSMIETVTPPGRRPEHLHSQEWVGGTIDPHGYELLEEFRLDGQVPVWRYALTGGVLLEKRLFMPEGSSSTVVAYTALAIPGGDRLRLSVAPLCAWRDHGGIQSANDAPRVDMAEASCSVDFGWGGRILIAGPPGCELEREATWYRRFLLSAEWERGLDAIEDLYCPAALTGELGEGETFAVTLATDAAPGSAGPPPPDAWAQALDAERAREHRLLELASATEEPDWIRRLVLAADSFVVAREGGHTVIAGYPWFGDWGRDTMISLPGLLLVTGRHEVARQVLRTFAQHVDGGMIPNRFPEAGEAPEYNTIDATLWYVEALRAYVAATGDEGLVDELWPVLCDILRHHVEGTRHGIGVDPQDGLLRGGEAGVQLTWMDAKVGDWVVTPRSGKPVEVNALWYNALCCLASWTAAGRPAPHDAAELATRVKASFGRFWDEERGRLVDVLDGPAGDERALRPNQLLAVSLANSPLSAERAARVVDVCLAELRTSLGLRTLAAGEAGYIGHYGGGVRERDVAYHQGTAWPWLSGPLLRAAARVGGGAPAPELLAPLEHHLTDAGLGSISEIADGDPPHLPRGCPWQAWSVAEALASWRLSTP